MAIIPLRKVFVYTRSRDFPSIFPHELILTLPGIFYWGLQEKFSVRNVPISVHVGKNCLDLGTCSSKGAHGFNFSFLRIFVNGSSSSHNASAPVGPFLSGVKGHRCPGNTLVAVRSFGV